MGILLLQQPACSVLWGVPLRMLKICTPPLFHAVPAISDRSKHVFSCSRLNPTMHQSGRERRFLFGRQVPLCRIGAIPLAGTSVLSGDACLWVLGGLGSLLESILFVHVGLVNGALDHTLLVRR